jgi:O-antigen/teichoic acid export membrane protein
VSKFTDLQKIHQRLGRDTLWNLAGNVLPLVVALLAVPYLIQRLGTSRFGLLSLAWVLIGYFSFFDLGLGRALTKWIADRRGEGNLTSLPAISATGVGLVGLVGWLGGMVFFALAMAAPYLKLGPDAAMNQEVRHALLWVAAGIPLTVLAAAYRGILEGFQAFRVLNLVRIPSGSALFFAPCVAAYFLPRLDVAVAAVVVARLLILVAHRLPARRLVRFSWRDFDRQQVGPMLRFGGWLTVSNFVGPLIVYGDRFLIGGLLTASAVAIYSAPFEVVSRLLVIPAALTSALFPALSHASAQGSDKPLARWALGATLVTVGPIACAGWLVAPQALNWWLGPEFSAQGTGPMRWMLLGFVFNALAYIPFTVLQSQGRTKHTALLHLAELPLYALGLYAATLQWGLSGAAAAWAVRAAVDMVAMMILVRRGKQMA